MGLFNNMKFPAWTMQQLNLDWILQEIKRVLGFFPETGDSGNVLMKTDDGTAWEPLEAVDLNINALPEDTELTDTDKLVFYDISASANRKITAPNLLNAMMSNGTPLMDGTGSAGTSKKPARYDHRHPTDTSRAPASYFQNNALKIANGGTGATTTQAAPFVRKLHTDYDVYVTADYDRDQVISMYQSDADHTHAYGLIVAKTFIGLWDNNSHTFLWTIPTT